jgi:hypothetical protein
MKQSDLFPKISAQFFNSPNNREEFFLFNTATNKGFAIDGFAAILCKKFTGEHKLSEVISSFEAEQKIQNGEYEDEITNLIADLEKNRLLIFFEEPQLPLKDN